MKELLNRKAGKIVTGIDSEIDRLPPERRRSAIVEDVFSRGVVRIEDLAERMGVSAVTIYRDVQSLEEAGLVERSKGELRPKALTTVEFPPEMRRARSRVKKNAVARLAATLVRPGNAVIVDDSSTVLPMISTLASTNPLTVITNSMVVARSLSGSRDNELVLVGGRYHPWADAFYGTQATSFVKGLRADLCFMSDAAIWDDGTYNPIDYVVDMKRAMLEQSFHRVLMLDSTKFERRAWQKTTSLTTFETIVVDDGASAEQRDMLGASGADVLVASLAGTSEP